jgi:hypothetical protein
MGFQRPCQWAVTATGTSSGGPGQHSLESKAAGSARDFRYPLSAKRRLTTRACPRATGGSRWAAREDQRHGCQGKPRDGAELELGEPA